jgi:hypothetical protein
MFFLAQNIYRDVLVLTIYRSHYTSEHHLCEYGFSAESILYSCLKNW